MALNKVIYVDGVTVITAENLNDIQDAIIALENAPAQGLTEDMKQALLQIARKVAYIDDQGQTYYDDLYDAFYPPKTVVLITAVFNQGSTVIYDDTALDELKQYLTVTAKYDDNTTAILADSAYTLSGLLEAGTSTVTVAYNGLTTTFTVNVTARPTLSSISAVYTQSGTVYDTDTLDSLKDDLVVTANYSDSSTQTVPAADYTLSGTLTAGTSTITVAYGGKTTTFSVTVTAGVPTTYTVYDYVAYIGSPSTSRAKAARLELKKYTDLNAVSCEFNIMPLSYTGSQPAILGRRSASGSGSSFAFYVSTAAVVTTHNHGVDTGTLSESAEKAVTTFGKKTTIKVTNAAATPSSLQVDNNSPISITWANSNVLNLAPVLFSNPINDENSNLNSKTQFGEIKFYDLSGNIISHYFPVRRNADNQIGLFDVIGQVFYTTSTASYATVGNSNCIYAVGNWS